MQLSFLEGLNYIKSFHFQEKSSWNRPNSINQGSTAKNRLGRISEVNKMMNDLYSDCVNIFKVFANVKFIPVRTGKYLTTETLSGNDVQTAPEILRNF